MEPDQLAYLYKMTFVGYFFPCVRDHGIYNCNASQSNGYLPIFASETKEYKIKLKQKLRKGIQQCWRDYRFRLVKFEKYIDTKRHYSGDLDERYLDEFRESRANLRLRNSFVADLYYSHHGVRLEDGVLCDQFYVNLLACQPELVLRGKTLFTQEQRGLNMFHSQVKNYLEVHEYVYHFSGVPIEFAYFFSDSFSEGYYSKKAVIDNKVTFYLLRSLYKVGWTLIHVHFTIINYWRK